MKLFVWEYSNGIMLSLAENVESAREMLLDKYKKNREDFKLRNYSKQNPPPLQFEERDLLDFKKELSEEPKIFDSPVSYMYDI